MKKIFKNLLYVLIGLIFIAFIGYLVYTGKRV